MDDVGWMGTTWLPPMARRCQRMEEARHVVLPATIEGGSWVAELEVSIWEAN